MMIGLQSPVHSLRSTLQSAVHSLRRVSDQWSVISRQWRGHPEGWVTRAQRFSVGVDGWDWASPEGTAEKALTSR